MVMVKPDKRVCGDALNGYMRRLFLRMRIIEKQEGDESG
jgi:hypothetical protein